MAQKEGSRSGKAEAEQTWLRRHAVVTEGDSGGRPCMM